jgi:plasmid stability protein
MASLMIRKIDEKLKKRLRLQAAANGRSMEEEARRILAGGLKANAPTSKSAGDAIAAIVDPVGGIELDLPHRGGIREPPRFD